MFHSRVAATLEPIDRRQADARLCRELFPRPTATFPNLARGGGLALRRHHEETIKDDLLKCTSHVTIACVTTRGRRSLRNIEEGLAYRTGFGSAYVGDALELLREVPTASVQAIVTSPPFALRRAKRYGNPPQDAYVAWFLRFAREFKRVLKDDGSLVIDIGGAWLPGSPTRSIYHFELLVALVRKARFHLAEEFYWYNRAKLPSPAQWVTVNRLRAKDAVNPVWWLSKTEHPKADNRKVLRDYTPKMRDIMEHGYNGGARPSGHMIGGNFAKDNGGSIPPNIIEGANTSSSGPYLKYCRAHGLAPHPARFPPKIPDFFIRFLTEPGDLVLDPFAGSNVTGAIAEQLGRQWLALELSRDYLRGSIGRFDVASIVASPIDDATREGQSEAGSTSTSGSMAASTASATRPSSARM